MIFYTADLHLGYFPILHDTARPFTGVPEMDEALISNWNARVGADDSVYIAGDFSYNGGEAPTQYLSRLNGHLHLIRGNHDTGLNHAERLLDYCDSVTDFLEIDDGGTHILLCHYPILHEKGGYMIHGQDVYKRQGDVHVPVDDEGQHHADCEDEHRIGQVGNIVHRVDALVREAFPAASSSLHAASSSHTQSISVSRSAM